MEEYSKIEVDDYGNIRYFNSKGKRHRIGGPAIEWTDNSYEWFVNGQCHRLDGPAVMHKTKYWYLKNKRYPRINHNILVLFYVLEPRRIVLNPTED